MQRMFSMGEVARLLGVKSHRIDYAISVGHLGDAGFRFLGKRCFTEADLRKIAKHFGVVVQKGGDDVSV